MTNPNSLFSGGGFEVTATTLQTPRQMFALANIEHVSVKRPLLLLLGVVAVGLIGFAVSFFRYLYTWEIAGIFLVSALAVVVALRVGTLRVHSLASRDDDGRIFGDIAKLNAVKAAVEQAMNIRLGKST